MQCSVTGSRASGNQESTCGVECHVPSRSILPALATATALVLMMSVGMQGHQAGANEIKLPPDEEKDSYEIYSMLLRTEMHPSWKITAWAIEQQTRPFRGINMNAGVFGTCLDPAQDQRVTYLPLIQNYVEKNKKRFVLERKFDLPEYSLVEGYSRAAVLF